MGVSTPAAVAEEFRLKSRIANKLALLVQDEGLEHAVLAQATGLTTTQVENALEGFVQDVPLFTLFQALNAAGLDLRIETVPSEDGKGEIFLDLQDEA